MIETPRFAERPRRMPLGTANNAGFFGVVIAGTQAVTQDRLARGRFDCMRDFMPESSAGDCVPPRVVRSALYGSHAMVSVAGSK
jgi:hypothetical protein